MDDLLDEIPLETSLQEDPKKLNAQGLSRRNKYLMECIEADPGEVVVSVDLSSGEPTVTAHFSGDYRYTYATYTGVGKPPYYDQDILMIDDVYLSGASVSPMAQDKVREAFHSTYRGNTFSEQWMIDNTLSDDEKVIKKELKEVRSFLKTIILAKMYGQGARGTVNYARDHGYVISMRDSEKFHDRFWNYLYSDVGKFKDDLYKYVKKNRYIINPFGFRMYLKNPKDAFNFWNQSSVSGIMHMLNHKFFTVDTQCKFITVIHDEVLFSCPEEHEGLAKKTMERAVNNLNSNLNWTVPIRTGWAVGKEWYTAK